MAIVKVEGKSLTIPDEIVAAGKDAIRAALSVDFPAVENAQIEIVQPDKPGSPITVGVTKRSTPKGCDALDHITACLAAAPAYVNPAIALSALVLRAEAEGDDEFVERAIRTGAIERAVTEGAREGADVHKGLRGLGHVVPCSSKTVPVGF